MESRLLITLGATFLVSICYLLAGIIANVSGSPLLMLMAGLLIGLLPHGLWKLSGKDVSAGWDLWLPGTAAFSGLAMGGAACLALLQSSNEAANNSIRAFGLTGILLGTISSGAMMLRKRRKLSAQCPCCQQPLGKRMYFCPRGPHANGHTVCAACWRPDHCRCKDCHWLRTPLLALQGAEWWEHETGKRARAGQCSACRSQAADRDLRPCKQCTRSMCVACWDIENGRCVKCSWVIENLPDSLAACYESVKTLSAKQRCLVRNAQVPDDF